MFTRHKNKKAITLWVDNSTIEAIDKMLAQRLARTSRQSLLLEALNLLFKTEADKVLQAAQSAFNEALSKQGKAGSRV